MSTWTAVLMGIWLWFLVGALTSRGALLLDRLSKKFHASWEMNKYNRNDFVFVLIFSPVILFLATVGVFVYFVYFVLIKSIVWVSGYKA